MNKHRINRNIGNKSALTIVELIVTITILSVLGTIAFISFQGFTKTTRDTVRVSDINSIKKSLAHNHTLNNFYPEPDNHSSITYSGSILMWKQGTFGRNAKRVTKILDKTPLDPLYENEYTYSITPDGSQYEIGGIMEDESAAINIYSPTYAATNIKAYVGGNYNGLILKASDNNIDYIFATPSIISNTIEVTDFDQIVNNHLVYNGYGNIPHSFQGLESDSTTFSINLNRTLVYTGALKNLQYESEQLKLLQNIQEAYNGNDILKTTNETINKLGLLTIDIDNPSSNAQNIACDLVKHNLKYPSECTGELSLEEPDTPELTPQLSIVKTAQAPNELSPGVYSIAYTITVENTGNGTGSYTLSDTFSSITGVSINASNISFTDDDGTNTPSVNSSFHPVSNNLIINSEEIIPGGSDIYNYTLTYTIDHSTSDVANICNGSSNPGSLVAINNTAQLSSGDISNTCSNLTIPTPPPAGPTIASNTSFPGPLGTLSDATVDLNGDLWFGTDSGIATFDGSTWTYFDESDGLIDDNVEFIVAVSTDTYWIGTHNKGISIYDSNSDNWIDIQKNNSGLLHNNIISMYVDNNGTLWIGSNTGVNSYSSGTWEGYGTAEGLSHKHISAFFEDSNNYIWFGTTSGLDKYNLSNGAVVSYTSSNTSGGMSDNDVLFMTEDSNSNIWAGTDGGGLSKYDSNTDSWVQYTVSNTSSSLSDNTINSLFIDSQNILWIGTQNQGVSRYDLSSDTWIDGLSTIDGGLAGNTVFTIYEDGSNNVIVVSNNGIDTISQ